MSFLNPISAPVKVYQSTDNNAPILDNSVGSIKTILKACLVTGYGDKEGAGWQISHENETSARFFIDNALMTEYQLMIDDSNTSQVRYNFYYQGVLNSTNNKVTHFRGSSSLRRLGWTVLVTDYGFALIEKFAYQTLETGRILYFGRVKSALLSEGKNICLFTVGQTAGNSNAPILTQMPNFMELHLDGYSNAGLALAGTVASQGAQPRGISTISITDYLYIRYHATVIGQFAGFKIRTCPLAGAPNGVTDILLDDRPALSVALMFYFSSNPEEYWANFIIYKDYWEF